MADGNYRELVQIYEKYKPLGLQILVYPCNQFAGQEPGSPEDIKKFAQKYGAEFPIMAKCDVNGENALPSFKFLRDNCMLKGKKIKWNFTKFLLDQNG